MGCMTSRWIIVDNQSKSGLKVFIEQDHRERFAKDSARAVRVAGGGIEAGLACSANDYEPIFNPLETGELMDLVPPNENSIIRIPGRGAYVRLLVQTGNDWEKFQDIRKFMNSGDTLVVTDDMIHMLFSAFEMENKTGHTIKVFNDEEKELATVVKDLKRRIRIQGQGSWCTFKVEPKDQWEKYESPREYMTNGVKFVLEGSMVKLMEGSFMLVNKSTFQVKMLVKYDDLPIDEIPETEHQEGDDCGTVTYAVNKVRVRHFNPGHSERFIIPGAGAFCMIYVLTLANDWKPFDDKALIPVSNSKLFVIDDKRIKKVLVSISKKRTLPGGNYLFVGNPGVGKSTLASSLCGKTLFKSGPSTDGSGVTSRLETYPLRDGVTIMDTPGLSDQEKRKEAAEAIEAALSKGGFFRIFFVITMEAGRIRPDDLTTIQIVLDGVANVTSFGIIINKVSRNMIRRVTKSEDIFRKWKMSITKSLANAPTPNIIINGKSDELEDAPCEDFEGEMDEDGHRAFTYTLSDKLFKFITKDVIGFMREDTTVKLDLKSYDELAERMGEQLAAFEELVKKMSDNQAKEIERLQKESDESVRKIQEEAARQAQELKEAQEHEARLRQKAIEEAEKKKKEEQEKYKRELKKLRKKAEEEAEAGLQEKDSQYRKMIEQMQKQNAEDIRKREEALAKLKKMKEQEEKTYKEKLARQQKAFSAKLKDQNSERRGAMMGVVHIISDVYNKSFGSSSSGKSNRKRLEEKSGDIRRGNTSNRKPRSKEGTKAGSRGGSRIHAGYSSETHSARQTNLEMKSNKIESEVMEGKRGTGSDIESDRPARPRTKVEKKTESGYARVEDVRSPGNVSL